MKKGLTTAVALAIGVSGLAPAGVMAHQGSHEVEIRDMAFHPETLEIDPGETVTWIAREDGHNVVSDTNAWSSSPILSSGETFAVPFPNEGTFGYKCSIHGMRGTIKVGDGCDGDCPVPDPEAPAELRLVPSEEFPSISAALAGAPPKTIVALLPGTYDVAETIEFGAPSIVLQGVKEDGAPAEPGEVVLRGVAGTDIGIRLGAAAISSTREPAGIANLSLTRFLDSAISIEDTGGFRVAGVHAHDNVEYGVRVMRSRGGSILDSVFAGHRRAGLSIEECESCDVRVRRVTSHDNFVGFQARNAGSLIVQDSIVTQNAAGIVLRSVATEETRVQRGNHFFGNTVTDNDNLGAPRPSVFALDEALEVGSGVGIWVQGGWDDVIENNVVSGNHYGIAVTGSTAPVKDATVVRNQLSGNTVDLGTDGIGVGVCFADNDADSSEPASIQDLYGCRRAVRTGVPYPKVTSDLATYAWRSYYCAELDARLCL